MKGIIFLTFIIIFNVITMMAHAEDFSKLPYPYYFKNNSSESGQQNEMQILHSGIASLQKRVDLIRKANKRISLEYFIWEQDKAGLYLFHELIKRAKEGIDVRIILDKSITVIEMDEFFAEAVKKYGIDLRYYNRALDPSTAQFRTHRKILVIDGEEGITGGRNIGDDYFDFDEVYNFLDRDVYVKGPIARAMQDSFDAYWNHPVVKKAKRLDVNPADNRLFRDRRNRARYHRHRDEMLERRRREAKEWIENREGLDELADELEKIARPILKKYPIMNCPVATYVSDKPGANFLTRLNPSRYDENFRVTRKVLFDYIAHKTEGAFYMASPYFMLNEDWQSVLSHVIVDKGVPTHLFTNSLGSTDAFYVAANFYRIVFKWQKAGLQPWIHDSVYDAIDPVLNTKVEQARWGMHEKTMSFNDKSFYIGTYNIDNRSDFYNAEMGIFCDGSKELTKNLVDDMKVRYQKGYLITGEDEAQTLDGEKADVYGNASKKQIKIMKAFSLPARLFEPLM